jgi:hypothetical protein
MVLLTVQVVATQYVKEVTHHRSTKRWKGLTAYSYRLVRMLVGIIENYPKQDVVRFPTPSTALLNDYFLVAAL